MSGAPVGAVVRIGPYWWFREGDPPTAGDFLQTPAGSTYLILDATHPPGGRHYYTCLKVDAEDVPEGARVCSLRWLARGRARRRLERQGGG